MKNYRKLIMAIFTFICITNIVNAQIGKSVSPLNFTSKNHEGVYLSANDFIDGKLTFGNIKNNNRYKFCLHEIFHTSTIKIINGNNIIVLKKDSIFGFCDKNTSYRIYNKVVYKIINPSEKILLYSRSSLEGSPKNIHYVTNYFFSKNANSSIYPLSKWNLKKVINNEVVFHELLDVYFHSDEDLKAFDNIDNIYALNHIYKISRNN